MNTLQDRVSGVHLFPIKSCQEATINGQFLAELTVGQTGFEHEGVIDRGLVIADEEDLFVSQRGWDKNQARKHLSDIALARIAVDIVDGTLRVSEGSHGSIVLPADPSKIESHPVRIFGPDLMAFDMGDEPARFFSEYLGRAVRLTKADRNRPRILPEAYQRPGAANQSAGADGRPFSLTSQASLDYLHDLVGWEHGTQPLNRYRGNIEIEGVGLGPFGEDTVLEWLIADILLYGVKALPRCPIPNNDQRTGVDDGRLSTKLLSKTRMGWPAGSDTNEKAEPMFGQSLNHKVPTGENPTIKVGDTVRALKTGPSNVILKDSMLR